MNKHDAQTLATRLTNLYSTEENEVKFTLPNYSDEEKMKNCFYVGIWLGDNIVGTTDEAQFDTLLRFARILVQTEEDLLQIGHDPNLDPTYANRMLMQAAADDNEEDPSLLIGPEYADIPNS